MSASYHKKLVSGRFPRLLESHRFFFLKIPGPGKFWKITFGHGMFWKLKLKFSKVLEKYLKIMHFAKLKWKT